MNISEIVEQVRQELSKHPIFANKYDDDEPYLSSDIFELQIKVMVNELQWSVDDIIKHALENSL